jgi:hypothetical protein
VLWTKDQFNVDAAVKQCVDDGFISNGGGLVDQHSNALAPQQRQI